MPNLVTIPRGQTQTRTAKSDVLRQFHPAGVYAEVNPRDADRPVLRSLFPAAILQGLRGGDRAGMMPPRGVTAGYFFINSETRLPSVSSLRMARSRRARASCKSSSVSAAKPCSRFSSSSYC